MFRFRSGEDRSQIEADVPQVNCGTQWRTTYPGSPGRARLAVLPRCSSGWPSICRGSAPLAGTASFGSPGRTLVIKGTGDDEAMKLPNVKPQYRRPSTAGWPRSGHGAPGTAAGVEGLVPRHPPHRPFRLTPGPWDLFEHARRDQEYRAARTRVWLWRVRHIRLPLATIQRAFRRLGLPHLLRRRGGCRGPSRSGC